ncbi:macrosialin [Trachinotus anak]|uniref:macrosialin n=1 Tax=Trachinotus anak TaxID=443729 RepID=UPI0039F18920
MKRTVVFVVAACCALSALSLAEDKRKSKPPATVSPAQQFGTSAIITPNATTPTTKPTTTTSNATTATPKPTTTTSNATTTTPKPTTTTPKPTTTTSNATTTTPKPTTTTSNATTTTPKPTTTTSNATTTTPKPTTTTPKPTVTPTPEPTPPTNLTVGKYRLKNEKNVVCLMADMALQIRLATPQANGTFNVVPEKTSTTGSCEEAKANLTLVFKEGFITLMFNKSVANDTAYVDALSFNLSYAFSKGAFHRYSARNNSMHLFAAKIGHSYSCKDESLYMGDGLYLDVSQDRMQAFNLTKSNDFGLPDVCSADKPDYRVAIGVGVTLLVLIVIVVIAYLLSRKRRTDGYQTL